VLEEDEKKSAGQMLDATEDELKRLMEKQEAFLDAVEGGDDETDQADEGGAATED
jgi:hypothetical protein